MRERKTNIVNTIDEEELIDLAELFKVFGDSTRIKILYALLKKKWVSVT